MKLILPIAVMLFSVSFLIAQPVNQQVIASSGSYTNNGNVALSTTVGEPVITTLSISNTTLTQGFQQPNYEVISNVLENTESNLKVKVYPNPSNGLIQIEITNDQGEQAQLNVTDVLGKILFNQSLNFSKTNSVNLNQLASGNYFFSITDTQGKLLSTHKIQKVN